VYRSTKRGRSVALSSSKSSNFIEDRLMIQLFLLRINFNDKIKPYCVLKTDVFQHSTGHGPKIGFIP